MRNITEKKPNKFIIYLLIGAVAILAVSGFFENGDKEDKRKEVTSNSEAYEKEEKRLESVLKRINGAGDVSVFISFEDGGEKILARDSKYKSSEEKGDEKKTGESEEIVVMTKDGSSSSPYVTEERRPEVMGVLVVAKGASSDKVKNEMYDAVKAIYGIPAHRIKITY